MVHQEVSGFQGCGEFRECHKVYSLRKFIHNGAYGCITSGGWKSNHKVNSYIRPWVARDWQGVEQTHGWLVGGFGTSTHRRGSHKGMGVCRHDGPPETLLQEGLSAPGTWIPGEPGGVCPLEDLEADRIRNKEMINGAVTWI